MRTDHTQIGESTTPWHESIQAQVSLRGALRIASAVAVLITLHVATRYFGADEWGVYVAATAIIVLFTVLEDFGLETVVARQMAAEPLRREILFASSLALRLVLGAGAVAIAIGLTAAIFPGRTTLLVTVVALAPTLIADAVQSAAASTMQATSRIGLIGVSELLSAGLGIPAVLAAAHWHLSLEAFAALMSGAAVCAAAVGIVTSLRLCSLEKFSATQEWASLLRLTLPFGIVLLISTTYAQIDTLILATLRPSRDVGFYGVATLITQLAASGPSFFMASLLPKLTIAGRAQYEQTVRNALDGLLLWFLPPLIGGVFLAAPVVDAVAGKSFHSASTPLMILLAGTAITLPTAAFGNSLVAECQEARLVRIGLMVLVVNVGLNLVLIPLFGIVGASAALVSSEALALVLTSVVFFRLHHTSIVPTRPLEIAVTGLAPVVGWALMIPTHFAGTQPIVRLAEVIPLMIFFVVAARLASSRLHSFDQTAES